MRLSFHILSILLISLLCLSAGAESQRKLTSYQKYISKYSDLAVQHQKKYRIPASITLAQGLLESGAGQSDLARRSNNHFGIKCHSDWRGGRVYHDDDLRGEARNVADHVVRIASVVDEVHEGEDGERGGGEDCAVDGLDFFFFKQKTAYEM